MFDALVKFVALDVLAQFAVTFGCTTTTRSMISVRQKVGTSGDAQLLTRERDWFVPLIGVRTIPLNIAEPFARHASVTANRFDGDSPRPMTCTLQISPSVHAASLTVGPKRSAAPSGTRGL
jgi:hypothetical protein